METILAATPKYIARKSKALISKRLFRDINQKQKNWDCKSATWSDYKHHNTVEFFVCVFPNSTTTL